MLILNRSTDKFIVYIFETKKKTTKNKWVSISLVQWDLLREKERKKREKIYINI